MRWMFGRMSTYSRLSSNGKQEGWRLYNCMNGGWVLTVNKAQYLTLFFDYTSRICWCSLIASQIFHGLATSLILTECVKNARCSIYSHRQFDSSSYIQILPSYFFLFGIFCVRKYLPQLRCSMQVWYSLMSAFNVFYGSGVSHFILQCEGNVVGKRKFS
jgi:hypothetical protein